MGNLSLVEKLLFTEVLWWGPRVPMASLEALDIIVLLYTNISNTHYLIFQHNNIIGTYVGTMPSPNLKCWAGIEPTNLTQNVLI